MKKKIALVLAFSMCSLVALSGCGEEPAQTDSSTPVIEETSEPETNISEEIVDSTEVDNTEEELPEEEAETFYLKTLTVTAQYDGNADPSVEISEYNIYGDVIRYVSPWGEEDNYEAEYEYEFDAEGRVIKSTEYVDGEVYCRTEYEYDADGRLVRETIYIGEEVSRIYEYNEYGDLVKNTFVPADRVFEDKYVYDANGKPISSDSFVDGELDFHTEYEYDEHGNLIKKTCSDDEGTNWNNYVIEYEYDDNGNLLKSTQQLQNGTVVSEYEYELVK